MLQTSANPQVHPGRRWCKIFEIYTEFHGNGLSVMTVTEELWVIMNVLYER